MSTSVKIFNCVPVKILVILNSIIATAFGIISFFAVLQFPNKSYDIYYYFLQACGFLSPIAIVYSAFRKEQDYIAYMALYFHACYIWLIMILYIFLLIIIPIFDVKLFNTLLILIVAQGVYIVYLLFAHYVFYAFYMNYSEIMDENVPIVNNDQSNNLNENGPYNKLEN